jgi:hypothetical protein
MVSMVKEITYHANETFAISIFNSCKDVYSPALGGPAMQALCGPWGAELCSPRRLFDFLGNVENPYVPFQGSILQNSFSGRKLFG